MKDSFGNRLKDLRTEDGIVQVELARNLGVSRGIISRWEHDLVEPTLSNIVAIAKFFGVSMDFLAGLSDF